MTEIEALDWLKGELEWLEAGGLGTGLWWKEFHQVIAALEAEPLEAPKVLAVVEGWVPEDLVGRGGEAMLEALRSTKAGILPRIPVTVTITRKPDES